LFFRRITLRIYEFLTDYSGLLDGRFAMVIHAVRRWADQRAEGQDFMAVVVFAGLVGTHPCCPQNMKRRDGWTTSGVP
jgi:hypothetical protein